MTNVVRTRLLLAVAVGVAGAGVVGQRNAIAQTPSPPPRKVVVVGDSIILGAQQPMTRALAATGRTVVFDAAVSRSTSAGAEAVAGHRSDLTDSLVVNLGANDAGSTALFARRVEKVLAAAGSVPRIYWLTIREVRPYYPAANQVLRDAARRYPNLHVVDWNAVAAAPGLTSGDGLHLTSRGALTMTDTLLRAIAAVEASGASKRTTTTSSSTTTSVLPRAVQTPVSSTSPSSVPVAPDPGASPRTAKPSDGGGLGSPIAVLFGAVVMAVVLIVLRVRSRRSAGTGTDDAVPRSSERARRIAEARAQHGLGPEETHSD